MCTNGKSWTFKSPIHLCTSLFLHNKWLDMKGHYQKPANIYFVNNHLNTSVNIWPFTEIYRNNRRYLLLVMDVDIFRIKSFRGYPILCFLGSCIGVNYGLWVSFSHKWLLQLDFRGGKNYSRFWHLLFGSILSSYSIRTRGLKTYFYEGFSLWKEEFLMHWEEGYIGKWCLEAENSSDQLWSSPMSH